MSARIAINGFGRIGRAAFKIINARDDAEVVVINDLGSIENLSHLLKYDTAYGKYDKEVSFDEKGITVAGVHIPVLSERDPTNLPWKDMEIDVVLECTGAFVKDGAAKAHIEAGAKKVVVSAPTKGDKDDVQTFVKGANEDNYLGQNVISNASCTTNCIAPVAAVIHSEFKVIKSAMTTIHGYTATQNLVDGPHKDPRRGRAAALNMIPTSTGAAIATTKTIPDLEGLFDGVAVRVPVLVGSLTDMTFLISRKTTVEEVNEVLEKASKTDRYKGVLAVTSEPIVSQDIVGDPHSSIVDLEFTRVIDGDFVKILSWYDNEWGYSNRLVEMALLTTE